MPGFTKSYINNGTFSFEKRQDQGNNQDFSNNPAEELKSKLMSYKMRKLSIFKPVEKPQKKLFVQTIKT